MIACCTVIGMEVEAGVGTWEAAEGARRPASLEEVLRVLTHFTSLHTII